MLSNASLLWDGMRDPSERSAVSSVNRSPSVPGICLTWSTVSFGEHSTTVDDNGKNPGVKEVVAVGRATGTGSKACQKIAGELRERTRVPEEAVRDARC